MSYLLRVRKKIIGMVRAALLIGVVVAVYGGCEDPPTFGIYAEIERSSETNRPNSGNRGVATSMIESDGRYYATIKSLFWRNSSADGEDWNIIKLPDGYEIAESVLEVAVGTDTFLIVAMTSSDDARSALYELQVTGDVYTWGDNLYRTAESSALIDDQINSMYRVDFATGDPRIFVLSQDAVEALPDGSDIKSYTLYYYHPGGTATPADDRLHTVQTPLPLLLDADRIVSNGNTYLLFVDRTGLYCVLDSRSGGGGTSDFTFVDGNGAQRGTQFLMRTLVVSGGVEDDAVELGGIVVQDDTIHVSSGRGQIFRYRETGGGSACSTVPTDGWQSACSGDNTDDCWVQSIYEGDSHRYTDMIWYDRLRGATPGMVIGIEEGGGVEGGYREITRDGTTNIAGLDATDITDPSTGSNYHSVELGVTTIRSFFVSGDALFALTHGFGVWRTVYPSDGTAPTWSVDLSR